MSNKYVKPAKVLKTYISSFDVESFYNESDADDTYNGYPYRWAATLQVQSQEHGDPSTLTPYYYTGDDIKVGDWFSASLGGIAVQIVEIRAQTGSSVEVVVEDIERYNLVNEPISTTTFGSGTAGSGVVFSVGDDGLPILTPLPESYLLPNFSSDMNGRFRHRNLLRSYVRVRQPGHGMVVGDVIRPDFANPGKFTKALADTNVASVIGAVSDVNIPSDGWFNFKPFGEIRENISPPLVGAYGDFFYVDPTTAGALTNVRPSNNARPVFMRLESATRGLLLAGGSSLDTNETKRYNVPSPAGDQVNFTLPVDAETVLWMSINGIENSNYTFDFASKGLVFNPTATGYGVDVTDEVYFIYKS